MRISINNVRHERRSILNSNHLSTKSDEIVTAILSQFLLGDVALTLLPIAVIALLRLAFGQLDMDFFKLADWSFAAIVVAGLAMVRILELKIIFQRDSSERPIVLSRICILVIVAAVLSLSLSQMADYGLAIDANVRLLLQFVSLGFALMLLLLAHTVREIQSYQRRNYPTPLDERHYRKYIREDVKYIRNRLSLIGDALNRQTEYLKSPHDWDSTQSVLDETWRREVNTEIQWIAEEVSKICKIQLIADTQNSKVKQQHEPDRVPFGPLPVMQAFWLAQINRLREKSLNPNTSQHLLIHDHLLLTHLRIKTATSILSTSFRATP